MDRKKDLILRGGFQRLPAGHHLAANKYPRQITIVETVPLTSAGKLDRKTLRTWIADGPAGF